jgi:hypothetical protein
MTRTLGRASLRADSRESLQAVLDRIDSMGVARIAGEESGPVVLVGVTRNAEAVIAALVPLISRRRDVFAHRSNLVPTPSHMASVRFGPEILCRVVADAEGVPAPLLIRSSSHELDTASIDCGGELAVLAFSGHPVETAHLIDSYLRDPRRHSPGTLIERARL